MGRRFGWLAVLLVGLALFALVYQTLIHTQNLNFVPAMILLGASVMPATFVTYVSSRGGGGRLPASLIAGTALLGGVLGTVVAGRLEFDTLRALGTVPVIAVGLAEEAAKLVVPVVLVLLLPRLPAFTARIGNGPALDPADGVIIGIAVGMGFAVLETMGYAFVAIVSHGGIGGVEELLFLRGLLSPVGHAAWTGLTSAALWRWAAGERHGARHFCLLFLLAAALHATWDGAAGSLLVMAVVAAVSAYGLIHEVHRSALSPASGVAAGPS
jgi:RsiW-degrading membrane proteinase PrsW (M82 family)